MIVSITSNVSGSMDTADKRAAEYVIGLENTRRASLTPPGTSLTFSTAAERKASYEAVLNMRLAEVHASYVQQAETELADVKAIKQALNSAEDNVLAQIKTLLGR